MAGKSKSGKSKGPTQYAPKKWLKTVSNVVPRVLKAVHPNLHASRRVKVLVATMLHDFMEKVANECKNLNAANKRLTIDSRSVQTAVRLTLPGELVKHAISEGTKAVTKYSSSRR